MPESYDVITELTYGAAAPSRRLEVRLLPYSVEIDHRGERVTYDPGSVTVPEGVLIPVTADHGAGVLERIGRVVSTVSHPDGLYGVVQLADTTAARDVHALLREQLLTDVSAGIAPDRARQYTDARGVTHRFGTLHHLAIVGEGAFAGSGTAGSRVLAVHNRDPDIGGNNVPPEPTPPTPDPTSAPAAAPPAPADPPVTYATDADVERLERLIAAATVPSGAGGEPRQRRVFRNLHEFAHTQLLASQGDPRARDRLAQHLETVDEYQRAVAETLDEFALADDTTTTAAGIVPDYLSSQVIGRINNRRPYVASIPSDPIGDHGMSVVYPKVVTKPDVGVQATEKTEVTSQAMDIDPVSVDLVTYAGASDVSLQLIERSQPSFIDRLYAELAGVYATRTDAAAVADAVTNAGDTEILADFSTDPAASWAAVVGAVGTIVADSEDPSGIQLIAATDRWAQLLGMVDSDGRPILSFGTGQNAQGDARLTSGRADWGGIEVILDPHAATGTALLKTRDATASLELSPQQLRAVQVDVLGVNVGVWGLFAHVVKYPDSLYTFTLA